MKHAICLFFVAIVCAFLSCEETKGIDTILKEMLSKHVEMRFDKMICYINGKDTIGYSPNDYKYLLIVNVDSTGCTPCSVSRLSQWKEWIELSEKKENHFMLVFVFHPRKNEIKDVVGSMKYYSQGKHSM